jgi:hypothetical protein
VTPAVDRKLVLNVGGGSKVVPLPDFYNGYEHVLLDIDGTYGANIVMDARKLELWEGDLPYFDAVYCSHNLEHYYVHDVPVVLRGMFRLLKPGGTVEIRVPDLQVVFDALALGADLFDVAYGTVLWHDMVYGMSCEIVRRGEGWAHKTGFTEARLRRVLKDAGFADIQLVKANYELAALAVKPHKEG